MTAESDHVQALAPLAVRRWHTRLLFWVSLALGILAAASASSLLLPALRVSVYAPDLRVVIEVVSLCVAVFAALALLVPRPDGTVDPSSNPSVTALLVLGMSNALFGVGPVLLSGPTASGDGYSFYPWIAARYIAAVLFIVAGFRSRPSQLRNHLALATALLAGVGAFALAAGPRLPVPIPFEQLAEERGGMTIDVSTATATALITAGPGLLFGVAAWLLWRVFVRRGGRIHLWLSVALSIQVLAQLQEVLYPSVLGPMITGADLLRSAALLVLLVGALTELRVFIVRQGLAMRLQGEDLLARDLLLLQMREFTEREEAFRSLVVHEVATPIAALRGFARMLADPHRRFSAPSLRTAVENIDAEAGRLQQLAQRMEELRTLELDHFHCDLRPVALCPLVREGAEFARALPGMHPVTIACPEDICVLADPLRLGQALRNLLGNAARFSPPRTRIAVNVARKGDGIQVVITDEGSGVPAGERERVLRKYERGTTTVEGSGLGLYIASRIAEAHGGRLYFTDPGSRGGARVVLELEEAR